jgi:GNAT superfamily N-acetyltransferase
VILKICEPPSSSECNGIVEIYNSIGWGGNYSRGEINAMYAGRYHAILQSSGTVAGIVRAFGDDYSVTWLAELAVHRDFQGKGLGSILMREFLNSHGHTAIYADVLPGQEGFFAKFGILPRSTLTACSRAAITRGSQIKGQ